VAEAKMPRGLGDDDWEGLLFKVEPQCDAQMEGYGIGVSCRRIRRSARWDQPEIFQRRRFVAVAIETCGAGVPRKRRGVGKR
jgi:hypothetical protein